MRRSLPRLRPLSAAVDSRSPRDGCRHRRVLGAQALEHGLAVDRLTTGAAFSNEPPQLLVIQGDDRARATPLPQRLADCLTRVRVFAGSDSLFDLRHHLPRQGDRDLLNIAHADLAPCGMKISYRIPVSVPTIAVLTLISGSIYPGLEQYKNSVGNPIRLGARWQSRNARPAVPLHGAVN